MSRREKKPHSQDLYRAVLLLKDEDECFKFFRDICSDSELLAMEQRFNVAKMLEDGKTYLEIQEATNASTATISRVGRTFTEGTGIITKILDEMDEKN
ncbi:YerC/YecD family TrpR-related protein [Lachnospiraceae bacterium YH-ros2228]|jgi:TrpR-related protein YerC/YecD|nr:YerC/YecD family TrpR-related protein [Lachnospiraceae bacterium]MDD6448300.1 YerC/YecD family TrpR-related protein [Lachnospiraceae bacterium]MDD6450495.1 YerC/YecD family TrpR-related protein [Lachnospiraceae bacterium]MDD6579108.1 YerC/YecD family TrpR-related protein [Lachnospiraceae bacterium]